MSVIDSSLPSGRSTATVPGLPVQQRLSWNAINIANVAGDNTVIAGLPGQTIRVFRVWFTNDANTLITFKDGSSGPFTGPLNFVDCRSGMWDIEGEPWFVTSPGNDFIINQTGAAQISGKIDYIQA